MQKPKGLWIKKAKEKEMPVMYIYYWLKKELQKPKALCIKIEREKERAGQGLTNPTK